MEHIFTQITGVDSLKQLEKIYKLKLSTIGEAIQMSSFEVVMPRFLSTVSSTHTLLGSKHSFLSNIKTYADWDEPHNGFKVKWKHELEKF